MLRGLDGSAVQGALPFDKLGPEYKFVILKAQEGNGGFDPWFARNAKEALDRGLVVLPYCFAYPLPNAPGADANRAPRDQAKLFVEKVLKACPELEGVPFCLDYEWPEVIGRNGGKGWKEWGCDPQQLSDWMQENAEEVSQQTARTSILYTYDWWWAAVREGLPSAGFMKGADVSWAADYRLWMAWYINRWPHEGEKPKLPKPFTDWTFWQFDGDGGLKLPTGVDSDFCVFNGDEKALQELIKPSPKPQPDFEIVRAWHYE